jgi:cell division protein FtsI (penicillin-binding protein 3)/stage V sporulation protein D (sporulation-specific penicillin-binding protein)
MLYQVVVNGTAKSVMSSKIPNVDFGGKTGTAEKYSQELKRYDRNSQVASFIGFSPARDVRYVCLVLMDDPKTKTVGGLTAGPVFRKIMESIYFHPKLSPTPYNLVQVAQDKKCEIDFVGMSVENAKKLAANKGCSVQVEGNGSVIVSQKINGEKDAQVSLKSGDLNYSKMPDLRGLSLKEALEAMSLIRMPVEFSGKGRVLEQFPEPSTMISKGQTCKLVLKEKV